ncbi:winged helix-turn-helix domain-containing protein [Enterococcus termitis]|jgi:DNA-binding response OmpR family regulator|uniref:OmpR/PhoB-type domain-containing protein n=1 Tax=Enterococcus termitis TaxID=332950 RepID=A0A1E5GCX9_9ENTE|nr:winged helix-turn-helix domain-containing protein [Enterococcus termitis]OEG10564.1 hypothetical protein BCR25_08830 [Enterococcus termitis]OJG97816.1 hypothetical protein RV18_GL003830 [Enterococcus termitis]
MRVGILDTEKRISEKFIACQTTTHFLESKEILEENDLKDVDALLICKNQQFGLREICEWVIRIKSHEALPIWVATNERQLEEKSIYLQLGVCGIFEKDYTVEEIDLSISNNLKAMSVHTQIQEKTYQGATFKLDPLRLSLSVGKNNVPLTKLEYCLLEILYENKEEVCTYEMLAKTLLGEEVNQDVNQAQSRVANIVCKVRAKIAQVNRGELEMIKTIRSRGYMLTLSA